MTPGEIDTLARSIAERLIPPTDGFFDAAVEWIATALRQAHARGVAEGAAAEREACAGICEEFRRAARRIGQAAEGDAANDLADAIRARGGK